MLQFKKKKLANTERVCLRLRAAREACGLSLETVAERTKINHRYLLAIEECRFDDIPFSTLYKKNFIKKYALAIDVEPEQFISQYYIEEAESNDKPLIGKICSWYLTPWPNIMRGGMLALCGVLFVLYLGKQIKHTISPPELALVNPDNGFITHENTIVLRGSSEPETKITVNGQAIRSNDHGSFDQSIVLNPGINTIVVVAKKKHGKSTQITRHIIYKETASFSLKSNILEMKN